MPTLPSKPAKTPETPETQPHRLRQAAESFGVDAERYDRTRQPYPTALIEQIVAAAPGRNVLDVGCGTGIAARQLQAAGCTVLGVEPDARMAEFARERGLEVEVSNIEAWEPAGRQFDAVIAATAWHWIDPKAGAAKVASVLRPAGVFAAFWHTWQLPPKVAEALVAACLRVLPDSPFNFGGMANMLDIYQPFLDKTADGIREQGGFAEPEQWRYDWERAYTREEWLDQLPTSGAFTRLPGDKLTEIANDVGAAIDTIGGSFTMPYTTVMVTAERTSPVRRG
ncbi:class I SAM-dependent methyltransferase [Flindersiella endophytica]